jgi:hypothetical protein
MLGVLSFIALGCIVGAFYVRFTDWGWKKSLLRGSVAWGVYLVLATELLSLGDWLTRPVLIVTWTVPLVALAASFARLRSIPRQRVRLAVRLPRSAFTIACLIVIVLIIVITSVIAWVAPPNTYDSLTYHMSRVAHWAQDRSLGPFATGILRQAYMGPGAEFAVLHLYILEGDDRLANFVEWLAMIVCIIGAAKITADLGGTDKGQWIAGLFVATLPMGIAQATSTMTDFVVAWWVVCAAAEVSEMFSSTARVDHAVYASLAGGLALLTKPTGAVFLAPLALLAFWKLIRNVRPRQVLLVGALGVGAIVVLNAGHMSRNHIVFGGLFGSPSRGTIQRLAMGG